MKSIRQHPGIIRFFIICTAGFLFASCSPAAETPPSTPVFSAADQLTPAEVTVESAGETPAAQDPTANPGPTLPPVSALDQMLGNPDAGNTLLVYLDYQSPACAAFYRMLPGLIERHQQTLRIVIRSFPLITVHDKALIAAQAAEAAARQGRFMEITDMLFLNQPAWQDLEPGPFQSWLVDKAVELGLDAAQFESDLLSAGLEEDLLSDFYVNAAAGLFNAPTLILNGEQLVVPLSEENIDASIRLAELRSRQLAGYPAFNLDPQGDYTARLITSSGTIEVLLYAQYAPLAVNSFITLAESGWYDNTPFYRVVEGSFVEAGDPTGTGLGNPGYVYPTETDPTLDFSQPGMVAMVASAPDANGSSFFISLEPMPHLDTYRTIFGRVTGGLDILNGLQDRDPMEDLLQEAELLLLRIEIEKK